MVLPFLSTSAVKAFSLSNECVFACEENMNTFRNVIICIKKQGVSGEEYKIGKLFIYKNWAKPVAAPPTPL